LGYPAVLNSYNASRNDMTNGGGQMQEQQTSTASHAGVQQWQGESLKIDLTGDVGALLRELGPDKATVRRSLVRYDDFRITLIAIRNGARIEEHHNPGRISVHTLTGHIRMKAAGETFDLPQGNVLVLDRAVRHDVEALEDSVFLLTAAMPPNSH
jgi:quercetin dioxygenase-like cupin family protein